VQFASEQRNSAGTSGLSSGGQAYVLVFGDDASSQAAYLKAKGMVTDGSSNWSGAKGGSGDRTSGTGRYDAHSGAFRGVAGSEPGEQPSTTGPAGQRDQEGKWSKTGSQVRVTGVLVSRGGIEAIRVSEITVDGSLTDPTGKTVGSGDRTRASGKSDNKSGQ
jgi:hypothetical protein